MPEVPLLTQLDGGDLWSTLTPASGSMEALYNATFGNVFNYKYNFNKVYESGPYAGKTYGARNIYRAIPGLKNLMDFNNVRSTHKLVTKNRPYPFWMMNNLFRKKKVENEEPTEFQF